MTRLLLLLLLAPFTALAQAPLLLRGPYLQMANPTALTVCWRTDVPGTGRVRCGTEENALTLTFNEAAPATDHAVRLTGLTPATHYYYAVETDGAALAGGAGFHFYTPPADGADVPVRFWVLGDPGTANLAAGYVRDAFGPLHAQRRADLWLMLGDNAYPSGADASFQNAVFNMYPDYLKTVPLWSCLGNHETYAGTDASGQFAYERIFAFPTAGECGGVASGTERYFSWNCGRVHFISLDSMTANRAPGAPMAGWLEADLEANTLPWVVAFWHHPPYSKGSHNSDTERELIEMRSNLVPILESHGVDLVLCGHSHNYERSYLLDGHYGTSDSFNSAHQAGSGSGREDEDGPYYKAGTGMTPHQGAVYVTAGSSGQTGGGHLDHPAHFITFSRLGSLVVDVSGLRMDVKFLRESTSAANPPLLDDWFSIIKGVTPPPVPQLSRGPYVQMPAPSAMTIRWRTGLPAGGRVRYGTAANALTSFADESGAPGTEHTVRLTGLTPGIKYYYRVEAAGRTLAGGPGYFFTTPPAAGTAGAYRVWVLGDSGTRNASQLAVRDSWIRKHNSRPADVWLMLGGNAYSAGEDADYQAAVFATYPPWLQQIPLWSCLGHHEILGASNAGRYAWDDIFDCPAAGECGGFPSGTERYYSWNYGHLHFIALDSVTSSRAADGPMAQWLAADLAANILPWTIVCLHHSPYTRGTVNSDTELESIELRANILPIIEQYGVDLVLSAHSQVYERSWLLGGHYGTAAQFNSSYKVNAGDGRADGNGAYGKSGHGHTPRSGTVYAVVGSSGQNGGGTLNHPAHFRSLNQPGSLYMDVTGDRMDVFFLRETYNLQASSGIDDYFTLLKNAPLQPVPATGLAVLPLTATTALLHWNDHSSGEERYRVRLLPSGGFWSYLDSNLPPNITAYTMTGLVPGNSYDAGVVANNIVGTAYSASVSFQQPANPPPPVSPVELWRFQHWGNTTPDGERAPAADPDADGSINLLEYALGSAPRRSSSLPSLTAARAPDGRLTFTFPRQNAPDLTYIVEFSATLDAGSWQPGFTSSGPENIAGPVTATDPEPDAGRRFARLRVTAP